MNNSNYTELDVYRRLIIRHDAWAQQAKNPDDKGHYAYFTKREPLSEGILKKSLETEDGTVGDYIVKPGENTVTNPQIDIDNHDGKTNVREDAIKVFRELQRIGYHPYIEASSGDLDQGAHVGVICKPTLAKVCKEVLERVLSTLVLKGHEVFPKQTEVNYGSFGNLIKLPFQFNNRTKSRSQIINPDTLVAFSRHDAIEYMMALPDSVFSGNSNPDDVKEKQPFTEQLVILTLDKLLSNPKIKPCIVNAYNDRWVLHGIGAEGHVFRGAVVTELLSWGASDFELLEYLSRQADYSEKISLKQIRLLREKQLQPTGCKRLLEQCPTLLKEWCTDCKYHKKPKAKKENIEVRGVPEPKILDEYHLTDLGNAQRLKDVYGSQFRYCHPMKKWLVWDNKRWNTDNEAYLEQTGARGIIKQLYNEAFAITNYDKRQELVKFALKCESAQRLKNMIELAKSEPGIPILPDVLDKDPMLFNVQNGTIDLRTGELKPHNKADYITKISPFEYNKEAQCPTWMAFLDKIFDGNKQVIEYMQRKAGYVMTGLTIEEEMDELYGTGGNGKSKYVNEILHIMGDYQVKANVETIQAASDRTSGNAASSDVARLKGARLVTISEPAKGTQLNEQRVKDWTGRDPITARHLYQEPITFIPEFKLWIYTNYKLRIRGTDPGIWRRVKLVPFIVTIPDEEQDKNLDKKLLMESSGILNWMIEGCIKWQKDGLKVPREILEATEQYREDQDYLGEFFKNCCEIDKKGKCVFQSIFLTYRSYCNLMDMPAQGRVSFIDTLESKKFKRVHEEKGNFYHGLRLKNEIKEKYYDIISSGGAVEADALTQMTRFLESFLNQFSYMDFTETASEPSVVSVFPANDNYSCGICQNPLNGEKEPGSSGAGPCHLNCIRNHQSAITFLKENFDTPAFSNPEDVDIPRLIELMDLKLAIEFPDLEKRPAQIAIQVYCQMRGWRTTL